MKSIVLVVLIFFARGSAAAFGSSAKGTTSAAFLTLNPGARESAMGGAFGGVADDALAASYNPAGLGFLTRIEAAAGREPRYDALNYDYAVLSVPVLAWTDRGLPPGEWGVAAASVYSLTAPNIDRRGAVETDEPTGSFSASNRAFALSYGRAIDEKLAFGGTFKYVEQSLDATRGGAFTGDFGGLWREEAWSAGAGVRNAYGRLSLGSGSDPFPTVGYIGGGWRWRQNWIFVAEIDQPRYDATILALGLERKVVMIEGVSAFARAGWRSPRGDYSAFGGTSWGFGVEWKGLNVEFSWSPGGLLGDVFQYSLRARF